MPRTAPQIHTNKHIHTSRYLLRELDSQYPPGDHHIYRYKIKIIIQIKLNIKTKRKIRKRIFISVY